jgi:hypothetical protein
MNEGDRNGSLANRRCHKLPNTLSPAYGFAGEWSANLGVAFDELERVKAA